MENINKLVTSNIVSYIIAALVGALMGIGLCKLL